VSNSIVCWDVNYPALNAFGVLRTGACVASGGSYRPGPTCLPVRSVGRGNLIGRDLGDFAAGQACSERSRRRSVLRGRL